MVLTASVRPQLIEMLDRARTATATISARNHQRLMGVEINPKTCVFQKYVVSAFRRTW
jgi:hypothetical protein